MEVKIESRLEKISKRTTESEEEGYEITFLFEEITRKFPIIVLIDQKNC